MWWTAARRCCRRQVTHGPKAALCIDPALCVLALPPGTRQHPQAPVSALHRAGQLHRPDMRSFFGLGGGPPRQQQPAADEGAAQEHLNAAEAALNKLRLGQAPEQAFVLLNAAQVRCGADLLPADIASCPAASRRCLLGRRAAANAPPRPPAPSACAAVHHGAAEADGRVPGRHCGGMEEVGCLHKASSTTPRTHNPPAVPNNLHAPHPACSQVEELQSELQFATTRVLQQAQQAQETQQRPAAAAAAVQRPAPAAAPAPEAAPLPAEFDLGADDDDLFGGLTLAAPAQPAASQPAAPPAAAAASSPLQPAAASSGRATPSAADGASPAAHSPEPPARSSSL